MYRFPADNMSYFVSYPEVPMFERRIKKIAEKKASQFRSFKNADRHVLNAIKDGDNVVYFDEQWNFEGLHSMRWVCTDCLETEEYFTILEDDPSHFNKEHRKHFGERLAALEARQEQALQQPALEATQEPAEENAWANYVDPGHWPDSGYGSDDTMTTTETVSTEVMPEPPQPPVPTLTNHPNVVFTSLAELAKHRADVPEGDSYDRRITNWKNFQKQSYPYSNIGPRRQPIAHTGPGTKRDGLNAWAQLWRDEYEKFCSYPEIALKITPGIPSYHGNAKARRAQGAAMKIQRANKILAEIFPVTATSNTYNGGYCEWCLFVGKCQHGLNYWAAETYCHQCAVVQQELTELHRKDKAELLGSAANIL